MTVRENIEAIQNSEHFYTFVTAVGCRFEEWWWFYGPKLINASITGDKTMLVSQQAQASTNDQT